MPDPLTLLLGWLESLTAIALIGGAWLGQRGVRALGWGERAGLVGLFALALAVRLHAPAVPHDINFRAWGAYSEGSLDLERGYGFPAFARLFHPLVPQWRSDDAWLFHLGAWVGALAPVALFAWLRRGGSGVVTAWTAALLLAVSAVHVRFSHTDAQQIPSLTLVLIGLAAWSEHTRRPSWIAALTTGAALAAAACGRLEAAALLGVAGLWVMVDTARPPWRHGGTWIALAIAGATTAWHLRAILGHNPTWDVSVYSQNGAALFTDHPLLAHGWRHLIVLDPAYTAPALACLTFAGLLAGAMPWPQRAALGVGVFGLSVVVPGWTAAGGESMAIARYQLAALPFALTLAAAGLATVAARTPGPWTTGVLLLAATLTGGWRLPLAFAPTTHSTEYTFVRASLPALPPGCVLLYDQWSQDSGLVFPTHLAYMQKLDLELVPTDTWTPDPARCTLYYRAATCSAHSRARPTGPADPDFCVGPGSGVPQTPLALDALPARTWVYDFYAADPVPVGFYRVGAPATPLMPPPPGPSRPRLVVHVLVDGLGLALIEAMEGSFQGGLVRLVSPEAWKGLTRGPRQIPPASGVWAQLSTAPLPDDGADGPRLWIDPTAAAWRSDRAPPHEASLDALRTGQPLDAYLARPWIPLHPGTYGARVPDSKPDERGPGGVGEVFPHPAATGTAADGTRIDRAAAFAASPMIADALTAMAIVTTDRLQLGRGHTTDQLTLRYTHLDRIQDAYTPESWEAMDALLRLDRTLGALFGHLDATLGAGRWAVVLSGGAPDVASPVRAWGAGVDAAALVSGEDTLSPLLTRLLVVPATPSADPDPELP